MAKTRITPGGLRIENFTRYDGDDLFAAICLFEKGLFPSRAPVLSDWPVDGVVVIRHAAQKLGTTYRVMPRTSIGQREAYAIAGDGVNRGVVKVTPPNRLFKDAMEALTFEIADEKMAPPELLEDILEALAKAYRPTRPARAGKALTEMRGWPLPVRVTDKPEQVVKRDGTAAKRKAERKALISAEQQVQGAALSVTRAMQSLTDGAAFPPGVAFEMEIVRNTLTRLRFQFKDRLNELVAPEHSTAKENRK